ncbi:MerR family DNA-binding transcriptional regulator [Streptomyces dangxiongensis]|uniref:MerR family DNA-binding transcriptional regulator n=1 Tax=Streptomyces dangxiongensis TaxID=1442032 RepID=A0A3G2JQI1_9ACTN|nr:MerR family DNA-binding transcriptional regulator [Streptomyces dangxiongensis]AYN43259.1 MerR family DNA-binding transcriptional regulator [Streptomyces dangxiongensis]
MSTGLRSGQVAEAAGVNIQTLRYYERRGLLAEPERTNNGHRLYGEDAVTALRAIKPGSSVPAPGRWWAGCPPSPSSWPRLAAGTWWLGQRRRSCSCAPKAAGESGCGCKTSADLLEIGGTGRR